METLREQLVVVALEWETAFGNAPQITTVLSEYDAAGLIECPPEQYGKCMQGITAAQKGHDFEFNGKKYQVKGNRPSGKKGSKVTWVPKARNYDWDYLIWILYDRTYVIQQAWEWDVKSYKNAFHDLTRLSPLDMSAGRDLLRRVV